MEEQEIRLTPNILKSIGEDTKVKILKELASGPRIPADISKKLNKSAPTIIEHLEKLVNAGLVQRQVQQGRKYVFYALTQMGQELLFNKSRISLVLYSSVFLFLIGGILLGTVANFSNSPVFGAALITANTPTNAATPLNVVTSYNLIVVFWIPIIILAIAFILLLIYVKKIKQINIRISG